MSDPQPPPSDTRYKNLLQEYAMKASIELPRYKTLSKGQSHAPQFWSQVWIDGSCFTPLHTCPSRKMAEQEAAKLALNCIRERVKNEGSARIFTNTEFCKSIISEYASKMGLGPPTYTTQQTKALLPFFVSTLVLNSVAYVGDAAKSKKEAEQVAARSAILSILDSEPSSTMSKIVRSKYKLFDRLKRKEVYDSGSPAIMEPLQPGQFPAIDPPPLQPTFEQHPVTQVDVHQPIHEFKKPRTEMPSEGIEPPIVFVPETSAQALESSASSSARKRKRRKAKKQAQLPPSLPAGIVPPQNPTPNCSTSQ